MERRSVEESELEENGQEESTQETERPPVDLTLRLSLVPSSPPPRRPPPPPPPPQLQTLENLQLALRLSLPSPSPRPPPPPPPPLRTLENLQLALSPTLPSPSPLPFPDLIPTSVTAVENPSSLAASSKRGRSGRGSRGGGGKRSRRSSSRKPLKKDPIHVPYPWATNRRATIHTFEYLVANGIRKISGQVCCKKCEQVYTKEVKLEKVKEVGDFVFVNWGKLHNRAPTEWRNPKMFNCDKCKQADCVRPITDEKKKKMNWLFLLLTQSLGCCTLEQLKYFCKHTKSHRTGAKDRVLYDTYTGLLRQLDPSQSFRC